MNKKYIHSCLGATIFALIPIFQAIVLGEENPVKNFSQKQYEILLRCSKHKDVNEWNQWRIKHPDENIMLEDVLLEDSHLGGIYLNSGRFIDKTDTEREFTGNVFLKNTRLNNAYLKEANFEGADLEQARLTRANLVNSKFARANLLQTHFEEADLQEANFENAKLKESRLQRAKLQKACLSNANLEKCNLERANLKEADLENANLESANLESTYLDHANLKGTVLKSANLRYAILWNAYLNNANLDYADLRGVNFSVAGLEGAYLRGANLEDALFLGTYLQSASFRACIVNGRTWVNTSEVDKRTDFREVALGNVRIKSSTKQRLEYNKRRLNWEDWYKNHKLQQWPVRMFWWISNYGISTLRVTLSFVTVVSFFSILYYILGLKGFDAINGLFKSYGQLSNKGLQLKILVRSFYFSVVIMTTLGFGDIHANHKSITGQLIVIIQVILGYFLLGALITRLGILFTVGRPAG